ncbi:hypothetical protein CPB85DRAFT_5746 [Mucidula mucida]|nr:hypothetical protein CPB85DRAFT_5746 [Mucidula mucida]
MPTDISCLLLSQCCTLVILLIIAHHTAIYPNLPVCIYTPHSIDLPTLMMVPCTLLALYNLLDPHTELEETVPLRRVAIFCSRPFSSRASIACALLCMFHLMWFILGLHWLITRDDTSLQL